MTVLFSAFCLLLSDLLSLSLSRKSLLPQKDHRACDIDGRIGSADQPNDQGGRKVMNDSPSEEEKDQHHHHHRSRSEDGPPKGFIDADIKDMLKAILSHLLHVLPDTIE